MAVRSRYLFVDKLSGSGDYNTIATAIAAAVASGASSTQMWVIEVGTGTFVENIVIPPGIYLKGQAAWQHGTVITGTVEVRSFGGIEKFRIVPVLNASPYALKINLDANGGYPYVRNCNAHNQGNQNTRLCCVEVTGAGTGAYARVEGCYFYTQNSYAGVNSGAAKCVVWHVDPSFTYYVEARHNCVFKTSTSHGTAQEIFIENEVSASSAGFGYIQCDSSSWESVYGGLDSTPIPILLQSANTAHPGALLDLAMISYTRSVYANLAYTGANPWLLGRWLDKVVVIGSLFQRYVGVDYPITPSLTASTAPVGAAPDGTTVFVI